MHKFLRAIGFSEISTREDYEALIKKVENDYTKVDCVINKSQVMVADYIMEVGENMGIIASGEFDAMDNFHAEYSFPYMEGNQISSNERSIIERFAAHDAYAGVCEDNKVGISIIYYLRNRIEYLKNLDETGKNAPVSLSGLSLSGMVMMPLAKNELSKKKNFHNTKKRDKLIEAARQGDEEAIESLTLDDIDVYSNISRKIKESDVYTIVDTYFMPYGVECDQYGVLGEIESVNLVENKISKEKVYQLGLVCNGINLDICINEKDLLGEPECGRRFKGNIWLQGNLEF